MRTILSSFTVGFNDDIQIIRTLNKLQENQIKVNGEVAAINYATIGYVNVKLVRQASLHLLHRYIQDRRTVHAPHPNLQRPVSLLPDILCLSN